MRFKRKERGVESNQIGMMGFSQGGHGYGLPGRVDSAGWTARLEEWMKYNKGMK